ncbi:MAG TPA: DUF1778 domain-containing protein [Capsulimonadaceae bacterium]|jgi:uncharacterized protein (DUF1778 family)
MATVLKKSPKPDAARRGTQFNIRMELDAKAKVERAAALAKQSLAEFTRSALIERADDVLARQQVIELSDQEYQKFVALMTGDATPTEIATREAEKFREGQLEGGRYSW